MLSSLASDGAYRQAPRFHSSDSSNTLGFKVMQKIEAQSDFVLLVARIFASALFIVYGYFKLTAYAGTTGYMAKQGLPLPALSAILAIIIELGGGILLLVGYQTRLAAIGLAI
jgi:putative oxidoreductase